MRMNPRHAIVDIMGKENHPGYQLLVRNLDGEIVRALRLRAARHGRSAEAEHREILRQALIPAERRRPLKEFLLSMPDVGDDSDFERVPDQGREVDL
jgi:plasmid stability protein